MKRKPLILCMAVLLITACNIPSSATPIAQTETPIVVAATSTADTGGLVTLNNVSFMIPLGVAIDAESEMVSAVSDANAPSWEVAPDHLKFTLTGYQVPDKMHEPQIRVYPADEYAQLNSAADEQVQRVGTILEGSALSSEGMPTVPFFNAAQQFAARMHVINFQSGRGIRFLTQYAQYPAPINNREVFYHFQGLTNDGNYYVIAILPVESSILAEDDRLDSPVPLGGVALPTATGTDPAFGDPAYYDAVTKALDAMYEDSFNPSLFQLDALIQSITVTP